MNYGYRLDKNQKAISKFLKKLGCSVNPTCKVQEGFPDLLVGYNGTNFLFEVKNINSEYGRKKLKPNQQKFLSQWKGQVHVVHNINDILKIIGLELV